MTKWGKSGRTKESTQPRSGSFSPKSSSIDLGSVWFGLRKVKILDFGALFVLRGFKIDPSNHWHLWRVKSADASSVNTTGPVYLEVSSVEILFSK